MSELEHFGVLGMHWGRHKAPAVPLPPVTLKQQLVRGVLQEVGLAQKTGPAHARAVLKRYGSVVVPAAKVTAKSSVVALRYSAKAAKGAGVAIRVLAVTGKYTFKFGKAYGRGVVKIAKLGR